MPLLQTVCARSVDSRVQPSRNFASKKLERLLSDIDEIRDLFFSNAFLDLNQHLIKPLNQIYNVLDSFQEQAQNLTIQGKDVEHCTYVMNGESDMYKSHYKHHVLICAQNFETILVEIDHEFGRIVVAGNNLLKELKQTDCAKSTDVELCKYMVTMDIKDIKTRYISMRRQATHMQRYGMSALKSCLKNPVQTLKRQVQNLKTLTSHCLSNI
ncbi:hypothetical protein KM043_018620 [Ampulex compressa]|nr:hypothetical protein KM043_018620 [Ampulex compressa]